MLLQIKAAQQQQGQQQHKQQQHQQAPQQPYLSHQPGPANPASSPAPALAAAQRVMPPAPRPQPVFARGAAGIGFVTLEHTEHDPTGTGRGQVWR